MEEIIELLCLASEKYSNIVPKLEFYVGGGCAISNYHTREVIKSFQSYSQLRDHLNS